MLKKALITAGCSIALCLIVTLWIVPAIKATNVPPEPAAPMYIVGQYEGKVAVFHYGEIQPFNILESDIAQFPTYDQSLLEKGIPAADDSELVRILEDYSE